MNKHKTEKTILPLALASALATGSLVQSAAAQTALEEVRVTAQKREQSLQEVPVAVSVFNADDLQNASFVSLSDALDFSPNVRRTSGPSGTNDAFFFFRGVGQTDNNINVDPGVGVYIDEVYLGRLQGASLNLFDAQRIEILRGPQGTFFGRNTMGGAVNMTTRDPSEEPSFQARVVAGERDRFDVYGAASGYLTDNFGARISAYTRSQDGWTESIYNGETYGDVDEQGARLKLLWDVSDRLMVSFGADYATDSGTQVGRSLIGFNPEANTVLAGTFSPPGAPFMIPPFDLVGNSPTLVPFPLDMGDELDADPFDDRIFSEGDATSDTDRGGANLTVKWGGDSISIKSITAWRDVDQETGSDLDGTGYHFYNAEFDTSAEQFSQEFQFTGTALDDRLAWTGGLYYMDEQVEGFTGICVGVTEPPQGPPNPFPPLWIPDPSTTQRNDDRCLQFVSNIELDVESYAAYGQVEYDLTDRLTAIAGFRYTDEEKDQEFLTFSDNTDGVLSWLPPPIAPLPGTTAPGVGPETPPYKFNKSWDEFSPRLGVDYTLNDDASVYFTWSNGFKSGGFAGRATPGKAVEDFDPETLESWELGFKSEWLDRRVRWNTAVFFSDYDDIQMLVLDSVIAGNPQFITINGGRNEIWGVESEVWAIPLPGLELTLGVGYLENEWKDLAEGAVIEESDELPNAPEWTVNFSAQYMLPLGDLGNLLMRGDYSYTSEVSFQPANEPLDIQDEYDLVNVRFAYLPVSGNWSVALYGRNVFEEEYFLTASDNSNDLGVATAVSAPPSEWGIELNIDF